MDARAEPTPPMVGSVTASRVHGPGLGFGYWFGATWLGIILFSAITASWLPLHPNRFDPTHSLDAPSWSHPFGTTRLGEDVFAICVHGSRVALIVGSGAAAIALFLGAPLGMAAGYFRGATDQVITTLLNALMAVPALILALSLVLFIGQSLVTIVVIIGVLTAPAAARLTRSATLAVVDRDFVSAARLSGARHRRVLQCEIGPNIAVPVAAYVVLLASVAILVEGALSFLGLGAPLDKASWGRLIVGGRDELQRAWWWSLCPSAVFFLTVLSLSLVSDALQARWLGLPRRARHRHGFVRPATPRLAVSAQTARHEGRIQTRKPRWRPDALPERVPKPPFFERATLDVVDLHTSIPTPYGTVRAVDGVSLRIHSGEMLAIVGESGAGKTMLARSILGIAPTAADIDGRVLLDGIDLRRLSAGELRQRRGREIAIVLQDPMTSLNPVVRVGHQIAELARVHLGLSRRFARELAIRLLGEVGIPEPRRRYRQYPHELSGGQRQRVAIALALSCGPKVLIADEPTSALDVIVQAQILDLIDRLRTERQLAVLLITHDLPLALARADRVAVMYAGRIVEQASCAELARGLRMPYASALFAAAPRVSTPSHTRIAAIPGRPPILTSDSIGCAFAPRCDRVAPHCLAAAPPLAAVDGDRLVACWAPLEFGASVPPMHQDRLLGGPVLPYPVV